MWLSAGAATATSAITHGVSWMNWRMARASWPGWSSGAGCSCRDLEQPPLGKEGIANLLRVLPWRPFCRSLGMRASRAWSRAVRGAAGAAHPTRNSLLRDNERRCALPGRDGDATPLLGCDVAHSLSQLPPMTGEILQSARTLAVLVARRHVNHPCPSLAGTDERGSTSGTRTLITCVTLPGLGAISVPRRSATITAPSSPTRS